jgi:methionyl-tRNA formyltransferase
MRMDAGLDTGPVAMGESISISPDDTAGDLILQVVLRGSLPNWR